MRSANILSICYDINRYRYPNWYSMKTEQPEITNKSEHSYPYSLAKHFKD